MQKNREKPTFLISSVPYLFCFLFLLSSCHKKIDASTSLPLAPSRLALALRGASQGRGGLLLVDLPSRRKTLVPVAEEGQTGMPAALSADVIDFGGWFFLTDSRLA